ncbi:MAG: hypothetical protein ACOYLS_05475 [Polymorphobacter sp.]
MGAFSLLAGAVTLAIVVPAAVPAMATPLTGNWAGNGIAVTAEAGVITIAADCASGAIAGPVSTDKHGRFHAIGTFEAYRPGRQLVDETAVDPHAALFDGSITGDSLLLIVTTAGAPPRRFDLTRGTAMKPRRCG